MPGPASVSEHQVFCAHNQDIPEFSWTRTPSLVISNTVDPSRFDPLSPSGLVRQSELKVRNRGVLFFARCFYCFWRFLTGFCARGLRSAPSLRRGVVDVACVRGAVRLLSHQQLRQLAFFRLLFSTLCLNTRFRFFNCLRACSTCCSSSSPHGLPSNRHALRRV